MPSAWLYVPAEGLVRERSIVPLLSALKVADADHTCAVRSVLVTAIVADSPPFNPVTTTCTGLLSRVVDLSTVIATGP
jgi:hypothetical protein